MISIVIPIYNEEKYLTTYLKDLISKLGQAKIKYEIILSENGSQDNTLKVAEILKKKNPKIRLITSMTPNYGLAVKSGFLSASGEYLVLFDLDYYDVPFITKALKMLDVFDAVIGAKRGAGSKDNRTLLRKFTTYIFSSILKLFFSMRISDTHGIKILNRKKFLPLIKTCKFTKEIFDTELLIRSQYHGLKLGEIPVVVTEKRTSRTSIIRRIARTLRDIIRLKICLIKEYGQL